MSSLVSESILFFSQLDEFLDSLFFEEIGVFAELFSIFSTLGFLDKAGFVGSITLNPFEY